MPCNTTSIIKLEDSNLEINEIQDTMKILNKCYFYFFFESVNKPSKNSKNYFR